MQSHLTVIVLELDANIEALKTARTEAQAQSALKAIARLNDQISQMAKHCDNQRVLRIFYGVIDRASEALAHDSRRRGKRV